MKNTSFGTVADYIAAQPASAQKAIKELRSTIKKAAPNAEEGISYGMPAYKLGGKPVVYFGVYPKHIGFYPTPSGIKAFKKDLKKFPTSKGAVQFPIKKSLPLFLIAKITSYRNKQILLDLKAAQIAKDKIKRAKMHAKAREKAQAKADAQTKAHAQAIAKAASAKAVKKPRAKKSARAK